MKLKGYISTSLLVCYLFTGCSASSPRNAVNKIQKESSSNKENNTKQPDKNSSFQLSVWNSVVEESLISNQLKSSYPNAELKFTPYNVNNGDKLLDMLASDQVPDIVFIDWQHMSEVNSIVGFENLLDEPYNGGFAKKYLTDSEWNRALSFDRKALIAIPLASNPAVTFYRPDILEKYGIPSDPDELGKLMQNPVQWLNMVKKLADNKKYIMQWKDELPNLYAANLGFFNRELNFNLNSKSMADVLTACRQAYKMNGASFNNVYGEIGQDKIRNGDIAMVYLGGSWGESSIDAWTKDSAAYGKWKVTKLPLGINAELGTMSMLIPSKSKHKQEAWEIVKKVFEGNRSYYSSLDDIPSQILGMQRVNALYSKLRKQLPDAYYTPIDTKANSIWINALNEFFESKEDAEEFLKSVEYRINENLKNDKIILINYLSKGN